MKKYYAISWDVDSTPAHLIKSFLLSVFVMGFINIFIGSMGGIPALVGFFAVFYLLRAMIIAGNRISHTLAMESRHEIRYMYINYGVSYLLLWLFMRVIIIFSKFSGWGNINGLSASEYLKNIYGSTMLEKWAYLFAGILMFAYIMSLFPLVVTRKPKRWVTYFVIDHVFFAVVCFVISLICRIFIDNNLENRASCVLDNMLLCQLPLKWEAALYIVGIVIFTVVVSVIANQVAVRIYSPKPGSRQVPQAILVFREQKSEEKKKKLKQTIIAVVCGALLVGLGGGLYFFGPTSKKPQYEKVAECLTNDSVLGPMLYENTVYVPVDMDLASYVDQTALGYIGYKDENCSSRFYQLAIANILYRDTYDYNSNYLLMMGADANSYEKMSISESNDNWKDDQVFLLWDEDWYSESAYGKDLTGYSECEAALIESLEDEFGQVEYDYKDFEEYDAYFSIIAYEDMKDALETEDPKGDWVGCILVRDNNFYYGNFENKITGVKLQTLLGVLGGN